MGTGTHLEPLYRMVIAKFCSSALNLFMIGLIAACNSPMNHRIIANGKLEKASTGEKTFAKYTLSASTSWLKGPFGSIKSDNHLLVVLYNDQGEPQSLPANHTLEFYATMPSMGHDMEDAGFFTEIGTGVYINKSIKYNMPGDWQNELWIMDSELNIADKLIWSESF